MALFASRAKAARPRTFAPRLEALEDRHTPAGISLANNLLTITGNAGQDIITITQNDALNQIIVNDTVQNVIFPSSHVSRISVALDAGDDQFTYQLASDFERRKIVDLFLGADNDVAHLDFAMRDSPQPTTIKHNLAVNVYGGWGVDQLRADFGDVDNQYAIPRLDMTADLGSGEDTAEVYLWGMLGGSVRASFSLLGNSDADTLSFYNDNGQDAAAVLNVNLDGGWGNDTVTMFFDSAITGECNFRLDGGIRGDDTVEAVLNVRAGGSGVLDVATYGGTGTDSMRLEVNDSTGGTLQIAQALMDGGAGVDSGVSTMNVTTVNVP